MGYRVVLDGTTLDGFEPIGVRRDLAQLIKKDVAAASNLLSGQPTTVKSDVDEATGERYLVALRAIGVASHLENDTLDFDATFAPTAPVPPLHVAATVIPSVATPHEAAATSRPQADSAWSHDRAAKAPPDASALPPNVTSEAGAPALWNPNAASNWSILFSPVFGAYLVMRNWEALGEPAKAAANRAWIVAVALFLGICPFVLDGKLQFLGLVVLVVWYLTQGRPQVKAVRAQWGDAYPRRGWGAPLGIAVLSILGYLAFVVGGLTLLEGRGTGLSGLFGPTIPQCSAPEVTGLVTRILEDAVKKESTGARQTELIALVRKSITINRASIRTDDRNPAKRKHACLAVLEARLPAAGLTPEARYSVLAFLAFTRSGDASEILDNVTLDGQVLQSNIEYTTQMADDGEHFYVEVRGYLPLLLQVVGTDTLLREHQRKSAANAAATAAPAPSPATPNPAAEEPATSNARPDDFKQ